MVKRKLYVVTGIVQSKVGRQIITNPLSKAKATQTKKSLQSDVKKAIKKYKWVTNLRVEKK